MNRDGRTFAWYHSRVRYRHHGQAVISVNHECPRTDERIGMLKSSLGHGKALTPEKGRRYGRVEARDIVLLQVPRGEECQP